MAGGRLDVYSRNGRRVERGGGEVMTWICMIEGNKNSSLVLVVRYPAFGAKMHGTAFDANRFLHYAMIPAARQGPFSQSTMDALNHWTGGLPGNEGFGAAVRRASHFRASIQRHRKARAPTGPGPHVCIDRTAISLNAPSHPKRSIRDVHWRAVQREPLTPPTLPAAFSTKKNNPSPVVVVVV